MSEDESNFKTTAGGPPTPVFGDADRLLETSPSKPTPEAATLMPRRRRIGHYRIVGDEPIGKGGFGVVYKAVHRTLRFPVAIKLLKPREGPGVEPWSEAEFLQEAERLARLRDHNGIVRILDYGVNRSTTVGGAEVREPYFVMEFAPGGAEARLTEYARQNHLDVPARLVLAAKVAEAVHYAHEKRILHLDLKPSNILVWPDGAGRHEPKVIDLGIAQAMDPEYASHGTGTSIAPVLATPRTEIRGTYQYMSPEQTQAGARLDRRSDVYSLGVVFYELLVGQLPMDLSASRDPEVVLAKVREEPPDMECDGARRLPGDVRAILERAMQKNRDERYPTAGALAADVRKSLTGELPETLNTGAFSRARARLGHWVAATPFLAAVVGILLAAIVVRVFVVDALYAHTSWASKFEAAVLPATSPESLDDTIVLDLAGLDPNKVLGEPGRAASGGPDVPQLRRMVAKTLSTLANSSAGVPSVVTLDLTFQSDRGTVDDELAAAITALGKRTPVVQGIDGWRFDQQGLPVSRADGDKTALIAPKLARATQRFGSIRIPRTTVSEPGQPAEVISVRYIVARPSDDAEPEMMLALATVAAKLRPALLPQLESVPTASSTSVTLRFFEPAAAGAVRRYEPGPGREFEVSVVAPDPNNSERLTAYLLLGVPGDAAIQRVTIPAMRVLDRDAASLTRMAGRMVIVGDSTRDTLFPITEERSLPGMYLHALAAQSLLGHPIQRPGPVASWMIPIAAAAIGWSVPWLVRRRAPWRHPRIIGASTGVWLVLVLGTTLLAVAAVAQMRYVVLPLVPIAAMVVGAGLAMVAHAVARPRLTSDAA